MEEYEKNVCEFNEGVKSYITLDHLYQKNKNELLSSSDFQIRFKKNRDMFIKKKLEEFISIIEKPRQLKVSYQSGISELFFLNFLRNNFKTQKILRNQSLWLYQPDFVLILGNGIHIDIEIDEPYDGSSKIPTHFYDKYLREFSDQRRNDYYLRQNWIVIRFSINILLT